MFGIIKNSIRILTINILIILSILLVLEIGFRLAFPEFKNHIHSADLTLNKKVHFRDIYGQFVRAENSVEQIIDKDGTILVFGDSISYGYGHGYHDIWWKQLERLLKIRNKNYQFISISKHGTTLADYIENIFDVVDKIESNERILSKVIYQFNFNDIQPDRRSSLKKDDVIGDNFTFAKWRYKHLNKSVFARVIQHQAGILKRKTGGTCENRGLSALEAYTWTFGAKHAIVESEIYWEKFSKDLIDLNNYLKNKNIKFVVLLAPILFQIDKIGYHPYYNRENLDFKCGTIDPIEKLNKLTSDNMIHIYNPIEYVHSSFMDRVIDENFEPFFFTTDHNHFTPIVSGYIADFMTTEWKD